MGKIGSGPTLHLYTSTDGIPRRESQPEVVLDSGGGYFDGFASGEHQLVALLRAQQQVFTGSNSAKFKPAGGRVEGGGQTAHTGGSVALIMGEHHLQMTAGEIRDRAIDASTHGDGADALQVEINIRSFTTFRQRNHGGRR